MIFLFHKHFEKQLRKLSKRQRERVKEQLTFFLEDPFHPLLNNHSLQGKYQGYRSISIEGDLRAIYKLSDSVTSIFVAIGTHSALYR